MNRIQALRRLKSMLGNKRAVRCFKRDGFCIVQGQADYQGHRYYAEMAKAETWIKAFEQARKGLLNP